MIDLMVLSEIFKAWEIFLEPKPRTALYFFLLYTYARHCICMKPQLNFSNIWIY